MIERLHMPRKLILASLVSALQYVALALCPVFSARAQVSTASLASESLIEYLRVVVRIRHTVEVGGMALTPQAALLIPLVLGNLFLHRIFILLALLGDSREEAAERLVFFEVVAIELVHEIQILGLLVAVLLALGVLSVVLGRVLLLIAQIVVHQIDVVELEFDLPRLPAHRVELRLDKVFVDSALLLVGRALHWLW